MLFDKNVDREVEWLGRINKELGLNIGDQREEEQATDDGDSLFGSESDSMESLYEIEVNNRKIEFPVYKDSVEMNWKVGMILIIH